MGCGSSQEASLPPVPPASESEPTPAPAPAAAAPPAPVPEPEPEKETPMSAAKIDALGFSKETSSKLKGVELTEQEMARLRKDFDEIDTDKSGEVGVEELGELLKKEWRGQPPSAEQVKSIMSAYDVDSNGRVTFEEYVRHLLLPDWQPEKEAAAAAAAEAEAKAAASKRKEEEAEAAKKLPPLGNATDDDHPLVAGPVATSFRENFNGSFKLTEKTLKILVDYDLTLDDIKDIKHDFNTVDSDASGVVSREEVRRLLTREWKGRTITDEEVNEAMKRYDANSDGNVTFDEYVYAQCTM